MSQTLTVKLHDELLPCASVTVETTVEMPIGKVLPEAGTLETFTVPSTISVAVGFVYVTTAPAGLVASTQGIFAGQL